MSTMIGYAVRVGVFLFAMVSVPVRAAIQNGDDDCLQSDLRYVTSAHRSQYSWVCCNNQHYAEHKYFLNKAQFFPGLRASGAADGTTTFYDAQCGIPLFVAPQGRNFAAFESESVNHGWPSFRDGEVVTANVLELAGGEIVSTCGTHLGHNLPDSRGNRYCINLVCMAGRPAENGTMRANSNAFDLGAASTSDSAAHSTGNSVAVIGVAFAWRWLRP